MAIKDTTRKPYIEDNDNNIFIGLDLPIRKGNDINGYFASTKTTIEAVKNNIRNLLNTHTGERLMQPILGMPLRRFLFEQITEESIIEIEDEITSSIAFWLPFVEIKDIRITTSDIDSGVEQNKILVNIEFNIKQDPNTLASVQVQFSGLTEETDTVI